MIPHYHRSITNCTPIVCVLDEFSGLQVKTTSIDSTSQITPAQLILAQKLGIKTRPKTTRLSLCKRREQKQSTFVRLVVPNSEAVVKVKVNGASGAKENKTVLK